MSKLAVLALGRRCFAGGKDGRSVRDQYASCAEACRSVAGVIAQGHDVIVCHSNDVQLDFILRRAELALHELHMVPLDSCVADTQGALGYHLQRALYNEFQRRNMGKRAAALVTQVMVDPDDPAFGRPDHPIGPLLTKAEAGLLKAEEGIALAEEAGGWRRVVPSPAPRHVVEIEAVKALLRQGFAVVAAGGGGIAVVHDDKGEIRGVPAVVDKDLSASLMAREIKADLLAILTSVDRVCLNFGKPTERPLDRVAVSAARRHILEGHFPAGGMLPKVKAAIEFIEAGGAHALITSPERLELAVAGKAGTHFFPG